MQPIVNYSEKDIGSHFNLSYSKDRLSLELFIQNFAMAHGWNSHEFQRELTNLQLYEFFQEKTVDAISYMNYFFIVDLCLWGVNKDGFFGLWKTETL
jgi:hypothetical protein